MSADPVEARVEEAAPGLAREGVRNFAWAVASHGTGRILVFVSTLVLARLLAPHDFGVFAAALAVINYLELALDLGVSSSVIYEQESGITPRVHVAFTLSVSVSVVLSVVGLVSAPLLASFFGVPGQVGVFRWLAVYLLLRGGGQFTEALLRRDLQFKRLLVVNLGRAVIRAVSSIILAWLGFGALSIVWGLLCGETAALIAGLMITRFRPHPSMNRAVTTEMLKYGLSISALKVLDEVGQNSDYLIVGRRLGPTALGYYLMAFRLPELLITQVLWVFSSVAFPLYSKARSGGLEAFRTAMLRVLGIVTLFAFSAGTVVALLARDAVAILLSAKWSAAAQPMVLISLALACSSVGWASGDIFRAVGKPGVLLKLNVPSTLILLVAFTIAAPHGITAVAWVHLIHSVGYAVLRLVLASRILDAGFGESLRALRPALYVIAGIAVFALPVRLTGDAGLGSAVKILSASVVGGAAGLLLGGRTTVEDLRSVARVALRG